MVQENFSNELADVFWSEGEISAHKGSLMVRAGKGAKGCTLSPRTMLKQKVVQVIGEEED